MTDIYLSYSEHNLSLAQELKKDVESCSSLSVALEDHDWEETDKCDFQEHINQAKMYILIAAPSSNITAWVIDPNYKNNRHIRSRIMKPPTVDFSSSYEEGMYTLKYVLRVVTGTSRFQKRRSSVRSSLMTKDTKPSIPRRSTSDSTADSSSQQAAAPTTTGFSQANQLPVTRQKRGSSLTEVVTEGLQQMLQRGLGSTMDL